MICMRRRSARRSACERLVTSTPSKETLPESAWTSRRIACAVVVLPQPDSPDERDHLSTPDRQRDAGHRVHVPLRPTQDRSAEAAGDAVADDEIVDLEERAAVRLELRHATTSTELAK